MNKPIYKKWWFWVTIVLVFGGIGTLMDKGEDKTNPSVSSTAQTTIITSVPSSTAEQASISTTESTTVTTTSTTKAAIATTEKAITTKPHVTTTKKPKASINATSSLTFSRNEIATLSITGEPNTLYSITVYYNSGASTASGLEDKKSNSAGVVSWSWKIGGRTAAGTYRVVIAGGGESKEFQITVQE
ncbi:MAG: hypothetical protein LBJ12_06945 [Oscillospiraceae bacterium]|jgi:hypothetical protein|nr:hypothetical protein [Oscillospiraceae bacterium]